MRKTLMILAAFAAVGAAMDRAGSTSVYAQDKATPVVIEGPLPLPVMPMDNPGRIPYQKTVSMKGQCERSSQCNFDFGHVPSGRRLVITQISGLHGLKGTPPRIHVIALHQSGLAIAAFMAPFAAVTSPFSTSSYMQQAMIYYEANELVQVAVSVSPATFLGGDAAQFVTLTGYLLDCEAFQCEAIVQ